MQDSNPRVAVVTGAADGLGREIALQLAARGWVVAPLDIVSEGAEESAARCVKGWPGGLDKS